MFKSELALKDFSSNSMFMLQVHLKGPTNTVLNNTCLPSELQMACQILTNIMIQFHWETSHTNTKRYYLLLHEKFKIGTGRLITHEHQEIATLV